MTVMKGIYRTVPENIAEKDDPEEPEQTTVSQDDLLNPHKPRGSHRGNDRTRGTRGQHTRQ